MITHYEKKNHAVLSKSFGSLKNRMTKRILFYVPIN